MFSKLETIKQMTGKVITIDELVKIVKSNPQRELIEKIRNVEYKSAEYNNLKQQLNCITPHGIFKGLKNSDIVSYSNYLYYDIDGIDTKKELNDTIKRLCDTFPITFLQRSVSNKGFHFFIKLNDTKQELNDTFNDMYSYVRDLLINAGFNIDKNAGGLSRKMIISSDTKSIFNNQVSLSIDKVSLGRYINSKSNPTKQRIQGITPNDTRFELIPLKELYKQIKLKTQYQKEIKGDYVIDDLESYTIFLPEKILDGDKHRLYIRIVNALYFINRSITKQQVLSYMFYVNSRATPPFDGKYLYKFILRICNSIESTGEIKIKTRIKKIHFNDMSNLTKKQKQSMGAQLNGKLRTNKTRQMIQNAKYEIGIRNEEPTQSKVLQHLLSQGIKCSIATIKRNWRLNPEEIQISIPNIQKPIIEPEPELQEISEQEFFNKETEIIRYKGFKDVEIEKITNEDKKLFISKINELKELYGTPSEQLILDMNIFSKEKTWYLYDRWTKREQMKNLI
jgi:hypothetical protein